MSTEADSAEQGVNADPYERFCRALNDVVRAQPMSVDELAASIHMSSNTLRALMRGSMSGSAMNNQVVRSLATMLGENYENSGATKEESAYDSALMVHMAAQEKVRIEEKEKELGDRFGSEWKTRVKYDLADIVRARKADLRTLKGRHQKTALGSEVYSHLKNEDSVMPLAHILRFARALDLYEDTPENTLEALCSEGKKARHLLLNQQLDTWLQDAEWMEKLGASLKEVRGMKSAANFVAELKKEAMKRASLFTSEEDEKQDHWTLTSKKYEALEAGKVPNRISPPTLYDLLRGFGDTPEEGIEALHAVAGRMRAAVAPEQVQLHTARVSRDLWDVEHDSAPMSWVRHLALLKSLGYENAKPPEGMDALKFLQLQKQALRNLAAPLQDSGREIAVKPTGIFMSPEEFAKHPITRQMVDEEIARLRKKADGDAKKPPALPDYGVVPANVVKMAKLHSPAD